MKAKSKHLHRRAAEQKRETVRSKWTCPECGATMHFETNGEPHNSPDLSLCCTNRVAYAEVWWKEFRAGPLEPGDIDKDGKVRCGNTWDPNQE